MKKILILALVFITAAPTTASAQEVRGYNNARGFTGMAEFGFLTGETTNFSGTNKVVSTSLHLFAGYRFHRLLAAGAKVGFDQYSYHTLAPIALSLRGTFLNARFSPIYSLDAGYGFPLNRGSDRPISRGGWMLNPALGIKASMTDKTAFSISFGYNTQRAKHFTYGRSSQTEREFHYRRMSVRLGFMF